MKTKFFALLFVLLSGLMLTNKAFAEQEKRKVPSFTEVSLRISGVVYIEQGNTQRVEIQAKPETLERIITEVKDKKLIIRFENNNFFWRNFNPGEIIIHITVAEINGLEISGSGNIIAKNGIKCSGMNLAISGSGNIKIADLKAEKVKAAISGSGDIIIEDGGVAEDLNISISGSGNVKAGGFEVKDVSVRVSGSGNSTVFATDELNVKVAGSGDVYYSGNPEINSSVAGSGSVRKRK